MNALRASFLDKLAERIARVRKPHPVRVGIDGVDGAGKTFLADELWSQYISTGGPSFAPR